MRIITGFFVFFLTLLVSGCTSEQKSTDPYTQTNHTPAYVKTMDDIIDRNGKLENKERFDEFLNRVQQGEDDHIRVVKYTTEGNPILYEYEFKKNIIDVIIDTTRDGYGQREVIQTTCTSINVNEDQERTSYELDGCTPPIGGNLILTVEKAPK